jgi:hypothetical protein
MTDGADWKQQRTARRLEWYSEDVGMRYDVLAEVPQGVQGGAKKGNGLVKVHAVLDEPRVEHVLLENIVVPPTSAATVASRARCTSGTTIDADELELRFPMRPRRDRGARDWAPPAHSYSRNLLSNDVECLWSYRLPIGTKPKDYKRGKKYKNYKPGRVTLVIEQRAR